MARVSLRAETTPRELDIPVLVAGYGAAFFEETAREFESLRPDLKVRIHGNPRINDQVRIRVMAGDDPDATDAVLLYPNLIKAGRILDLAPYLDGPNWEGDARWRDTFLPGVLERWTSPAAVTNSGETTAAPPVAAPVYGLPFAHAVWTIFYDKKRFRENGWEVPRTWDEFFILCEKMERADVSPLSLPGVFMRYGDAFLRAAHYNLVGPDGWRSYNQLEAGARTDPRFIRAAGILQRLATRHLVKGWEGMTHTAAQLAFIDGRAAMTISASWFASEMRGKLPAGFELGAMNLPVFAEGIAPVDTIQTQSAYYFLFTCGDKEQERATVDFFRFLTSRERAKRFAQLVDSPVALRAVGPDDYSPLMRDTAALIAKATGSFDAAPPTSATNLAVINQALTDARYRLMTGRITPEEFGARLESAATAARAREINPDNVETRHGFAAAALLLVLAALVAWLVWIKCAKGRRSAPAQASSSEHLGRLRGSLAMGFVGPSLLLFGAFVVLPGLASFIWAFTRWDGLGERTWAGLFNFRWLLLESDVFWFALRNNLFLMIAPALVVVPAALFFAALIHRGVWGGAVFRVVFLFPNMLGGIAATLLWMSAYDPHGGLVNTALVKLGFESFEGFAWLSQAHLYAALLPIYLWMACGFNLVLYLAAMQGISPDLYEAADLEGASPARQFFTITLPLIWEVLVISAVFLVIGGLNAFEMIWLLTSQDPASGSHTLSTLMVSTMFQEFQVGRATAIAVMMFVLVLVGSAAVMRALRRDTVEM
ncbi:extracellular solute-binding protein [Rariglobus hedericola]|uniref:extracellular solute-binding protein n=1 Tax=Rariglobus hedericola TaxID=2597822 RepID=UPI001EEFFC15|nr:extracellular solute-binding protein [Rariglobus hedericola]